MNFILSFFQNVVELPKNLSYSLRFPSELRTGVSEKHPEKFNWFTNLIYPPHNQIESRAKDRDGNLFPNYEREGFLAIQNAIARAYIRQFSKDEMPKIQLQVSFQHDLYGFNAYLITL